MSDDRKITAIVRNGSAVVFEGFSGTLIVQSIANGQDAASIPDSVGRAAEKFDLAFASMLSATREVSTESYFRLLDEVSSAISRTLACQGEQRE
ncbi:hypothetical protein [Sphingobium sp. HDIP04]|uniref:hypothetical protein n=1 Tax=Sphingobium sp. HDIP04 TaxID=428994 RepID=UPI000419011E|nr:hypothetical protein [Sphingobium sp. HDIP04]